MTSLRVAALYLSGGLIGGFALSAFLADEVPENDVPAPGAQSPLERRMAVVERRLDAAISANAALSDELARISGLLETRAEERFEVDSTPAPRSAPRDDGGSAQSFDTEALPDVGPGFERARRAREEGLAAQLTAAGFSESDARQIETRVEELRVAAMQSRYEALRSGAPVGGPAALADATDALRTELGDAQYERFLEATGRPTRVGVTSVLASSAAQTAGILTGDEIVAYGGERVFDVRDLNRTMLEGDPGEPVVVDILREGQPMQVVMPRGPLGIASGFRRRGGG